MDLIEEFSLPSEGKIYSKQIPVTYSIRAPRLSDRAIGNTSSKNKIQSEVLLRCLEPKPEIVPYDWHTSDYTMANLAQRKAARGSKMPLRVICRNCQTAQDIEVDLDEVKITKPKLPFDLEYTTAVGEKVSLRFFTPRILDQIKYNIKKYKEDYPNADQDIGLQETVRAIVVSVDGETLPYSKMTNWLMNCYEVDLNGMVDKVVATNFGPVLIKRDVCPNCGNIITYSISPDEG